MLPLKSQTKIATDIVRRGLLRVFNEAGTTFNDEKENFSDLQELIKKNITILKKIKIEKMIKIENAFKF